MRPQILDDFNKSCRWVWMENVFFERSFKLSIAVGPVNILFD